MTVLIGFLYVIYFLLLGVGTCISFNLFTKNKLVIGQKTEFLAHAFFQGVFFHIVFFNLLQLFDWSTHGLLTGVGLLTLICAGLIVWQLNQGVNIAAKTEHHKQTSVVTLLVIIGSIFIYWNGHLLPNIAWDSWAVWEGKAEQWIIHGLNADIAKWDDWLQNNNALFNQAANYPDGLSLIYYLPKLIFKQGFAVTHVVYLFAFAMLTVLLISRVAKNGTSIYLLAFMVLIIYTVPMISNHLMIQGYADIWLAMYVLLIMLTLMDYKETWHRGAGIRLLCYLTILPMLKLEGWVWLLLFVLAYVLVWLWQCQRKKWVIGSVFLMACIIVSGIIDFTLPFGDLIINHNKLVIFNLIDTSIQFVNITDQLLISFFWQNNWSLIWLGLPFLIVTFFTQSHDQVNQVVQVFFIAALLCFLFLFYFTEANKWAIDLTAINRLALQLTPCYLFLLFKMFSQIENY